MGRRLVIPAVVGLSVALALTGCIANTEILTSSASGAGTSGSSTPTPDTLASEQQTPDQKACTAFFDVLTITANADVALSEGRTSQTERDGWYALAARVLDRIPVHERGPVSDALSELKSIAPAGDGGYEGSAAIGSAEWNTGLDTLSGVCDEVDVELGLAMFTGG
jgi:hypothetical protein